MTRATRRLVHWPRTYPAQAASENHRPKNGQKYTCSGVAALTCSVVLIWRTVGRLPVPHQDPGQIRSEARSILRRPEFRPSKRSWWSAAIHWVVTEIGKLLDRLFGLGGGSALAGWVAVAALVVVIGLLALLVVRFWVRMPADPSRQVVVTASTAGRSAVDWRAEAASHERAGRWRDALRCRYRALVADLAGRGLVEEIPGRTAGEYRGAVQTTAPAVAADFTDATELFEEAWYGDRPTGLADQASFDELAGRVLTGVAAGPR
jgi:hypothetical protein